MLAPGGRKTSAHRRWLDLLNDEQTWSLEPGAQQSSPVAAAVCRAHAQVHLITGRTPDRAQTSVKCATWMDRVCLRRASSRELQRKPSRELSDGSNLLQGRHKTHPGCEEVQRSPRAARVRSCSGRSHKGNVFKLTPLTDSLM